MKKHRIDLIVKEKLENQHIKPSDSLWESITDKLEQNQVKSRGQKQKWSIAAAFVITLGLGTFFYTQPPIEIQTNEEVTFDQFRENILEKPSSEPKPIVNVETPHRQVSSPLEFNAAQNLIPFQIIPFSSHVSIQAGLEARINKMNWSSGLEQSLLDLEVDSLMNLAMNHLKSNNTENARRKELALSLLLSVEDELNSEVLFKYKVLDILKSSYSKINVVLNESSSSKIQNNEN
ncbi:MAG: hypothetical protein P8H38_04345 [Flavobacteriaceae bacterium]|nr:hypothetical protein [Flavobacteriaceae bacterium]